MFAEAPLTDAVIRGGVLTAAALLWVLVLSRIVGLRSFSKMTAFDFVATIASGSLLANAATASELPAFLQSITALAALFLVQFGLAWLRQRSETARELMDNRPHVLLFDGEFDEEALRRTRVSRADILAKMREADTHSPGSVKAVVLESTGDISIMRKDDIDPALLEGLDNYQADRASGQKR